MPTQKWCSVRGCKNFIFATLDDFGEYGWSAFSVPANAKALCFCPDHQTEMMKEMEKRLTPKELLKSLQKPLSPAGLRKIEELKKEIRREIKE